eukprot:346843-Prorocentrum_minimum.AAC.1
MAEPANKALGRSTAEWEDGRVPAPTFKYMTQMSFDAGESVWVPYYQDPSRCPVIYPAGAVCQVVFPNQVEDVLNMARFGRSSGVDVSPLVLPCMLVPAISSLFCSFCFGDQWSFTCAVR